MFKIIQNKLKRRTRKYPIKRDEYGKSARRWAFDKGKRPVEVSRMVGVSLDTACRYFADWKKQPRKLEIRYHLLRESLKSDKESKQRIVSQLVDLLGISEEELEEMLLRPWGLKQLMMK